MATRLIHRRSIRFSSHFLPLKSGHSEAKLSNPFKVLLALNPFSSSSSPHSSSSSAAAGDDSSITGSHKNNDLSSMKDADLRRMLNRRRLKGEAKAREISTPRPDTSTSAAEEDGERGSKREGCSADAASCFSKLGLNGDMVRVAEKKGMKIASDIQGVGIPAILKGKSVLLSSPSESGKTVAYLLPLIQLLSQDEQQLGKEKKPVCPPAVILFPTREKSLQAFSMAEFFCHDAHCRPILVTEGAGRFSSEESTKVPTNMLFGTLGGVHKYMKDTNMVFSDIRYLVLDQIDSMHESGLGHEISKFLGPLKSCKSSENSGFQAILVANSVAKLLGKRYDPFVERFQRDHAGEVAAVMLEMEQAELYHLMASLDALKERVVKAMAMVDQAAAQHEMADDSSPSSPSSH